MQSIWKWLYTNTIILCIVFTVLDKSNSSEPVLRTQPFPSQTSSLHTYQQTEYTEEQVLHQVLIKKEPEAQPQGLSHRAPDEEDSVVDSESESDSNEEEEEEGNEEQEEEEEEEEEQPGTSSSWSQPRRRKRRKLGQEEDEKKENLEPPPPRYTASTAKASTELNGVEIIRHEKGKLLFSMIYMMYTVGCIWWVFMKRGSC